MLSNMIATSLRVETATNKRNHTFFSREFVLCGSGHVPCSRVVFFVSRRGHDCWVSHLLGIKTVRTRKQTCQLGGV